MQNESANFLYFQLPKILGTNPTLKSINAKNFSDSHETSNNLVITFEKNITGEMYCKQKVDELTQKLPKKVKDVVQEFFFNLLKIGKVYTLGYDL